MLLRFRALTPPCLLALTLSAGPSLATPVSLLGSTGAMGAPLAGASRRAALLPDLGSVTPGLVAPDLAPAPLTPSDTAASDTRSDTAIDTGIDTGSGDSAGAIAAAVARDLMRGAQATAARPATPASVPTLRSRPKAATATKAPSVIQTATTTPVTRHVSSLFSGRAASSLFAPSSRVRRPAGSDPAPGFTPLLSGSNAARLKHLIASVESHRDGYDAVQYAARIRPPKRPTQMTLTEIYDWIAATPGQQHAIGRYQIIPKTLRYLARSLGTDPRQIFSPTLQDRFADKLLQDAGYDAFLGNNLTRHGFMHNLAQVWAGLPTASGKSYYHGLAGNRAAMTWARFDAEMARIFPG